MFEMNLKEAKKMVNYSIDAGLVPLLIGSTGVGKTSIIKEMAKEKEMDCVIIHVSNLEPSDFLGLPAVKDGRTTYSIPDWLPIEGNANPNGGIIFLDEINRGREDIRQALYQFISSGRIHTYQIPANYHIVAAANPPGEYEVYDFDKALMNRFAWIKIIPRFEEIIGHLSSKHGESKMLEWINTDKALLETGDLFEVEGLSLSPRTLDSLTSLYELVKGETEIFIKKALSCLMQKEKVESLLTYLKGASEISLDEILKGEKKTKLTELIEAKKFDVLISINNSVEKRLVEDTDYLDSLSAEELGNLTGYFMDLPKELSMSFIENLDPMTVSKNDKVSNLVKDVYTNNPRS